MHGAPTTEAALRCCYNVAPPPPASAHVRVNPAGAPHGSTVVCGGAHVVCGAIATATPPRTATQLQTVDRRRLLDDDEALGGW